MSHHIPWAGDTPCQAKCSAKHPLPRLWGPGRAAPAIRKCKMRNTTGKAKNLLGFNPTSMGDAVAAWKAPSPWLWSKDETLVTQELREGPWEPPGSWAPPARSLASVCVYIYIYLSLSISLSHAALGVEEEQRAKQEVRMGAPACREQGHPKAHSHTALASTSGFFLAYILQQYHNSLQDPEPWHSSSSGAGADPVPAGAAVLAPPALSHPGSGGSLELPLAPTTPWLPRDVPVSCLAWGSLPSGQGRQGHRVLSATAAPPQRWEPRESFLQLSLILRPQPAAARPGSRPGPGTRCSGSRKLL